MATDPDLGSSEQKFADLKREAELKSFDFNTVPSPEQQKLYDALREAKPSALKDGFGIRGPQAEQRRTVNDLRRTDALVGSVSRRQDVPDFAGVDVEQTTTSATAVPNIAFILSDRTTTVDGAKVYKVHVFDGKINGAFPSGMGFGNYVLTLPTSLVTQFIYAGVTFNPSTLAETSKFLGVSTAAAFPESRVESDTAGFLYWQLGFTYISGMAFKIVNTWVGDINFQLIYGSQNGQPSLLPVHTNPGWLDLAFGP